MVIRHFCHDSLPGSFLNSVNMTTVLTRLQVQDVDAGAATSASTTLFVRCRQKTLSHNSSEKSSSNGARLPALQLDVAEGDALWRGEVTEGHKPMVLDCSASEYLSTLEAVFNARTATDTAAGGGVSARRAFVYKWSRKSGVLTLMEESVSRFAMKYTSLTLSRVRDNEDEKQAIWQSLLQEIVDMDAHATQEMKRQRVRIEALETLLKEKDAVLETALQAKQQLEDQLFEGFCAVLNAKKDEIQRLQHELVVAQMQMQTGGGESNGKSSSSLKKKEPRQFRVTEAKGAKLKRKAVVNDDEEDEEEQGSSREEEEAESHDDESDSQRDDDEGDDDSAGNKRSSRRAKRGAIDAYSQLPSDIRSSSQVCSADDVLSNLDAIINQENEANVAIQEGADAGDSNSNGRSRAKRPRSTAPPVRRIQDKKMKQKSEVSSQEDEADEKKSDVKSQESKVKPAAPVPPPRAPSVMDSEEEDLFDMLT